MVSVLLVSPRSGESVARAEYNDVLRATGLSPEQLTQRMLDTTETAVGSTKGFDGVIVGGSPLNVTNVSYDQWQLHVHSELQKLIDAPIPVFFICYGTALATSLTGGTVGRSYPEASGPTVVQLTEEGRHDRITCDLPPEFVSLTGHTESAEKLGQGVVLLATGPTCPIQMVRINNSTWACQFHAEMDAAAMKARMDFYFDYGYFTPEDYDSIVAVLPHIDTRHSNKVLQNFIEVCRGVR
ncbi:glutamine amidotransferase [Corynebacterium pseudotuberculosis]|uniref:Glutamine amidotransferase n=2 Tax=Corynebacterium pseudotuberculosis TaxID=1719 RepID=D9QAH6_CORP2|nr:glutamine amidotransferase [Corynebacterium pseudotuberculosis]AER69130.1 Glutamine amidotransferase class-I [Corynebacterium pseudotuberculosis 1/06-A]ADK28876.1 glutamine amidotransferase [Corynebacterium pseudotuberculosis FRC41]ADL10552.1 glutamine amidotransferase [Corynebacterium pseudotuberculosis C231]ADL20962.1 glutamine amidotransferase [Corynebacterium pseudotuberculosis 1002]ADO26351.1 glutamine amidotransferase [Corynebacterium pseudotuberculosis I19]